MAIEGYIGWTGGSRQSSASQHRLRNSIRPASPSRSRQLRFRALLRDRQVAADGLVSDDIWVRIFRPALGQRRRLRHRPVKDGMVRDDDVGSGLGRDIAEAARGVDVQVELLARSARKLNEVPPQAAATMRAAVVLDRNERRNRPRAYGPASGTASAWCRRRATPGRPSRRCRASAGDPRVARDQLPVVGAPMTIRVPNRSWSNFAPPE